MRFFQIMRMSSCIPGILPATCALAEFSGLRSLESDDFSEGISDVDGIDAGGMTSGRNVMIYAFRGPWGWIRRIPRPKTSCATSELNAKLASCGLWDGLKCSLVASSAMDEVLPAVVFTLGGFLHVFAGHSFGSPLGLHIDVEEVSTSPPATLYL